jgi:hypothetical protein
MKALWTIAALWALALGVLVLAGRPLPDGFTVPAVAGYPALSGVKGATP